jgi:hypothetical protein
MKTNPQVASLRLDPALVGMLTAHHANDTPWLSQARGRTPEKQRSRAQV